MNYTTKCDEDTAELMEFKMLVLVFLVIRHSYTSCDLISHSPVVNVG